MAGFDGQINVAPKIIYWIEAPIIKKDLILELLKRDLLLVPCRLDDLENEKQQDALYIYNFDQIANENKNLSNQDRARKIIQHIKSFKAPLKMVHTNLIDELFVPKIQIALLVFKKSLHQWP